MTALPKFNIKNLDLNDEALDKMIADDAPKTSNSPHFRPGAYDVQIGKVEYKGQSAADATWAKYVITLNGAGGKTITDMIMVPTTSKLTMTVKGKDGPKESTAAIARLKEFIMALGSDFSVAKLGELLTVYFSSETALVGQNLNAQIGYAGTHIAYLGKVDGQSTYGLAYRSGDRLDNTPTFQSFEDAKNYCAEKNIGVKLFVEVLKYDRSSVGNSSVTDSDW